MLQGPADRGNALMLHEAAHDVPLALRELLEALLRDGGSVRNEGLWAVTQPVPSSESAKTRVAERLRALDAGTRAWVQLVASAGQVPVDVAAGLVDEAAAAGAELSGLVRLDEQAGAYRLDQPLDRYPVLKETGSRAHRRALRALADAVQGLDRPLTRAEAIDLGRWRLDIGDRLPLEQSLRLAAVTSPTTLRRLSGFSAVP